MVNGGVAVNQDPRRDLPSVDRLAADLRTGAPEIPVWAAIEGARSAIAAVRDRFSSLAPGGAFELPGAEELRTEARRAARLLSRPHPQRVVNATGIVLHTNLGRAPIAEGAARAAARAATRPSDLELDLETGRRGQRLGPLDAKLSRLSGAEAGFACNNGAGAVLLGLATLAAGREVVVSRGELVEIGGSFRVPEIMERAGVRLVEVGSTNRTHLRDYEQAITEQTALLMKVHASNYRLEGFTSEVPEQALASLARTAGIPFVIDLGSGSLVDFASLGLPQEPTAAAAIANGADLITFSGDKLLGGPQAGLIAGRRELIAQLDANPLKRALRLDKLTLAAMEAVLKLYRNPSAALDELPTLRQLTRPQADIAAQAERLAPLLSDAVAPHYRVSIAASASQIGSGALPVECLPSVCLCVSPQVSGDSALRHLATVLRSLPLPIIGRLQNGTLWLDLRCLEDEQGFTEQLPPLTQALA